MRRLALLAALLALTTFVSLRSAAFAADPVVTSIEVEAPDHLTVGDHLRYVIRVEADRDTVLGLPSNALPPELTLTSPPRTSSRFIGPDRAEFTLVLEVAPFVPGEIDVPPIAIAYRAADGTEGQVQTGPTSIVVESVLPASGELAPRDLKPQAEIGVAPADWLTPTLIAVAALVVLALGLIVWSKRRKRVVEEPAPLEAEMGPEDRARAVLDAAGIAFEARHDYVAYYSAIAVTMRQYLTERFGFPAFALTTREMNEQMVRRGVDRWQARITGGLLTQCDAVIFAAYRPALERADADLTAAYEIVEMSRPEPVPEAVPV